MLMTPRYTVDPDESSRYINEDLQTISDWPNQWVVAHCPKKRIHAYVT